MSSVPFHYVDLRAFCYVTEDEKRVEEALRTFLPEDVAIERATSEGHHGDRIVVMSARVENADGMRVILDQVGELDEDERDRLIQEADERVNENCTFFATFDKQAAFNGDVELGDGITLRAKVEVYPANPEPAIEATREALGAL